MTYRFLVSVRGSLVGLVYTKTIDLSITALDESVAVTLMSSDTGERYPYIHTLQAIHSLLYRGNM
jgi:hypothetical protein